MSPEPSCPAKRVADSITTMTQFVLPSNANAMGTVFGGQILAWMDLCAAICAQRHTGQIVVTAGIDDLSFDRGANIGQVVHVTARMTAAFRSSVELYVTVEGEDAVRGERWPCVTSFMTFVAIDEARHPVSVPALVLETEEEQKAAKDAEERRTVRLARRHAERLP